MKYVVKIYVFRHNKQQKKRLKHFCYSMMLKHLKFIIW